MFHLHAALCASVLLSQNGLLCMFYHEHFLCWYVFSFSHFITYFCFHFPFCISAIVSPLAFHMPCCINISVLLFACRYECSLSQIILFLISRLVTDFPDPHCGFQCSCYTIHWGVFYLSNTDFSQPSMGTFLCSSLCI